MENKVKNMPTDAEKIEIFKWLEDSDYQTDYEETGEYKMYFAIDMPHILKTYSDLKCQPLLERIKTLENTVAVNMENISQLSDVACEVEDIEIKLGFGIDSFIEKYECLFRAIESWKKEEEIWNEHLKELQEAADKLAEALSFIRPSDDEGLDLKNETLANYNKLKGK